MLTGVRALNDKQADDSTVEPSHESVRIESESGRHSIASH